MTEPNGFEYALESTQQRVTSIIMRKSPNNATLVQRTPLGTVSMELTEDVRAELAGMFAPMPMIGELSEADLGALAEAMKYGPGSLMVALDTGTKRKPGRPPKVVGDAA
jgi:hypothetical protein